MSKRVRDSSLWICIADMCRSKNTSTCSHTKRISSTSGANVRVCVCVKVSYVTSVADLLKVSISACVVTVCLSAV